MVRAFIHFWTVALCVVLGAARSNAQASVFYRLDAGSDFFHEFCVGGCACPYHAVNAPLTGAFTLTFVESDPLFDHYVVTGLSWVADVPTGFTRISGGGTYRIGGEVAVQQQLQLDLMSNDGTAVSLDSGLVGIDADHPFPQIAITLVTMPTVCTQLTLTFVASPVACPADLNGDRVVGLADLSTLLAHFGESRDVDPEDGDIDDDQDVDLGDLAFLLGRFGESCP
jgi:hypothetical protein